MQDSIKWFVCALNPEDVLFCLMPRCWSRSPLRSGATFNQANTAQMTLDLLTSIMFLFFSDNSNIIIQLVLHSLLKHFQSKFNQIKQADYFKRFLLK